MSSRAVDVLMLEERADIRELIREALRSEPTWSLDLAADERMFRESLHRGPDLVLADDRVSGPGAALVRAILKETSQDIPVVVICGALASGTKVEEANDMFESLHKSHLGRLPAVVKQILRQGDLVRETLRVEGRFEDLVDRLPAIVYTAEFGADGRWMFVSSKIVDILGFTPDEWIDGGLWAKQLHAEDADRVLAEDEEARRSGTAYDSDYRLCAKDGHVIWVQDRASVWINDQGEPCLQGFLLDITEGKEAELLAESRIKQQSALAEFGSLALSEEGVATASREACVLAAETLGVRFARVLEAQSDGSLLASAGVGWEEGIIGCTIPSDTQAGYAFKERASILVEDLRTEKRFGSPTLIAQGAISGITVPIGSGDSIYGVLAVHHDRHRAFSKEDIAFVQGLANVIAGSAQREQSLTKVVFRNRLLARVDAAMVAVDADGNVSYWNEAAKRLYGWSSEEAMGRPAVELLSVDLEDPMLLELSETLPRGRPWEGEWTPRRKDGTPVPVYGSVAPLIEDGSYVGTVTVSVDITQRKRMESELRDSEAKSRRLLDGLPFGVYVLDAKGKPVFANQAATELLGTGILPDEHADDLAAVYQAYIRGTDRLYPSEETPLVAALRGEKLRVADLELQRKDVRVPLEIWGSPILDANGELEFAVAAFADTTERVKLEDQLRHAAKLEAVGSLAAGVAHDFNNLLSVILNFAAFILQETDLSDPRRKDIEEISRAAERGAGLVRQLLTFSRQERVVIAVVNVNDVLEQTTELLRRSLGEDIQLELKLDPEISATRMDPGQVEQILVNLAVNARDAMPRGGSLIIETSDITVEAELAQEILRVEPGPYIRISISDTGVGMSPEVRERIFEPFFTTKGRARGTGLGLATIYGIVKQAGGAIWVYSEVDQGTTFNIYLPTTSELIDAPIPTEPIVSLRNGDGRSVLVVEDESGVRRLVARILNRAGFDVVTAANAHTALELASDHATSIDVVLTDVIMPSMSGKQLAERVAELRPGTKILYMSGYTDDIVLERGMIGGQEWFIQKPFNSQQLLQKLAEVIGTPSAA